MMAGGWMHKAFLAVDTESTGLDTETVRIVTATTVRIEPRSTGKAGVQTTNWLLACGEIPAEATKVHGVTTERANAEGVDPHLAVAEIAEHLVTAWGKGWPVIAFNAVFDLTLLDREMHRHYGAGLGTVGYVIDPFVLDKGLDRYRKGKRTLAAACEHYGVELGEAHTSAADALAAARVAWQIGKKYPAVGDADLASLHAAQIDWYAEQTTGPEGLAAYFRKLASEQDDDAEKAALHAKADGVDGTWPLKPYVRSEVPV